MTDKKKISKFLKWINQEKKNAYCPGSGSSWNWAFYDAMTKVHEKANEIFSKNKIKQYGENKK